MKITTELIDHISQLSRLRLPEEEKAKLQSLPASLDAALDALEADHGYLTRGGVFPEELLDSLIAAKRRECREMAAIPHPAEFERYFDL